jgi:hypothetical protein
LNLIKLINIIKDIFYKLNIISMNMRKKSLLILITSIFVISSLMTKISAQINPNVNTSKVALPTRLIFPSAYPEHSYGLDNTDVVLSFGPFDNYQVSTTFGFCETTIIVNPSNPLNFVGTDNRVTGYVGPTYVYYTTDGGVTWNATTSGISGNAGDPVVACDGQNNFYLAVLAGSNYRTEVFKSVNGGASWTNLGVIPSSTSQGDKEWIACDQTQGTYKNNVYTAYANFDVNPPTVDFWRSTNNGSSWTFTGIEGTGSGSNICVDLQGRVFLAWNSAAGASCRVSTDGGASFGSGIQVAFYQQPGTYNGVANRFEIKNYIRVTGFPQIACDMTTGAFSGNVYCVFNENPPGPKAADIYFTRTTDHGATWSANSPLRVTWDDNTYSDNWMTDVSVDNLGRVWVYWWDGRNDSISNIMTETWAAVSTDGGASFSHNFKVGNQNFNPNAIEIFQQQQSYYLGDYQEMSGKTITFPFWIGNGNTLQDFTAYLPDYGISFRKPVDSVQHGFTEVNRIVAPMMGPYSGTVTYTATVSPSPSPGTITFTYNPSNVKTFTGNPDSILINANVSAGVPYQNYTVAVTAAESGGPRTHIRSYTLTVYNFTGIAHGNTQTAYEFALRQNYPNPFNPTTEIDYSLAKQSLVNLKVYDVLGREVASIIKNQLKPAGSYNEDFNASNLPSGVYYYKLTAGDFTDIKKMILVK